MIEIVIDGHIFLVDPEQESIRITHHLGVSLYYFEEIETMQFAAFEKYPFKKALAKYKKLAAFV